MLVNGPRQCGKTTLVQHDPLGFARQLDRAIIDEVQRAPQLLLALMLVIDQDRRPGRFLLTGSADPTTSCSMRKRKTGRSAIRPGSTALGTP